VPRKRGRGNTGEGSSSKRLHGTYPVVGNLPRRPHLYKYPRPTYSIHRVVCTLISNVFPRVVTNIVANLRSAFDLSERVLIAVHHGLPHEPAGWCATPTSIPVPPSCSPSVTFVGNIPTHPKGGSHITPPQQTVEHTPCASTAETPGTRGRVCVCIT
jgi:hypothetical protein